jgi:hypothetical protein
MEAAAHSIDPHPGTRNFRVILWILIVLAAAEFIVRGPARYLPGPSNWNDLSQNYTASKLWLRGLSPADPRNFVALWKQEGGSRLDLDDIRTHLAPPPGGLIVLAPVAVLPWKVAKPVWLAILLVSFAATVWALALTCGFRRNEVRTLAFVAACLALAPFQTGIASGNTSVLVIGLCAVAIWAARRNHDVAAGILFGLACAVKPQIGAFLVLYYLVRRRWKLFVTAFSFTVALTLVAAVYLQLRSPSWIQDYLHNATGYVTANHIDDFTAANPSRFTLINLQVPVFSMTGRSASANILAFAIVGLLVCLWIYRTLRRDAPTPDLLALGAISVIALLPVYHRFYDAALLAVPLGWCIANAAGTQRAIAKVSLFLMVPFLAPGTAFLQRLADQGCVSDAFTHSWWWNDVVMPHETWSLLLLFFVLLYGMWGRNQPPGENAAAG